MGKSIKVECGSCGSIVGWWGWSGFGAEITGLNIGWSGCGSGVGKGIKWVGGIIGGCLKGCSCIGCIDITGGLGAGATYGVTKFTPIRYLNSEWTQKIGLIVAGSVAGTYINDYLSSKPMSYLN